MDISSRGFGEKQLKGVKVRRAGGVFN